MKGYKKQLNGINLKKVTLKMSIALFSLIGFLSTFIIIKFTKPFLKKYLLDIPEERSSHLHPIPRGGGLAFTLTSTILLFILNGNSLIFLCLPIAVIGFIDDINNVPQKFRFFIQILTCILLISQSKFIENFLNFDHTLIFSLISLFILFVSISIINFTNFVDGLDGFLASAMIPVFITASVKISPDYLIIVACISAFLIYNWSPAKVFMGDVGSTYLGAIYVLLIFSTNNVYNSIGLYLITAPLQIDCITCILRRIINSQNIFTPHKNHLYQRLNQSGWTHKEVSYLYAITISFLSLGFIYFGLRSFIISIPLLISIGIFIEYKLIKD